MIGKKVFITLGLSCLLLFGCQAAHKIGPESSVFASASYDSGFALFEAEETKKEESAEYLDYVTAGIKLWTSESLELKLTNVSNETIRYGEAFAIEVLHNGVWEKLLVLLENYEFDKGVIV